jgi:hypothetical protein
MIMSLVTSFGQGTVAEIAKVDTNTTIVIPAKTCSQLAGQRATLSQAAC